MNNIDQTYFQLAKSVLNNGFSYEDPNRVGIRRLQIPHYTLEYDFIDSWDTAVLTTKRMHFPSAVGEFVTFIKGENNLKALKDRGVNFWDKDAYRYYKEKWGDLDFDGYIKAVMDEKEDGDLGRIYPYQMRNWNGFHDQIQSLISVLKTNPLATKKTVTMWNPTDNDEVSLTPCHHMFEVLVEKLDNLPYEYGLRVKFSMGSVDVFLGLPYNLIYYSLMTHFLANISNMVPLGVIGNLSNVHIYEDHIPAIQEQLKRDPLKYNHPKFTFSYFLDVLVTRVQDAMVLSIMDVDDFILLDYEHYPHIKAEMFTYNKEDENSI